MNSRKAIFICMGVALFLIAPSLGSKAVFAADTKSDATATARSAQVPVIAIIPPIHRGNQAYATLSPAFTTMLGAILDQSGRVLVVDRTNASKVFDEKDMAAFSVTDRTALAKKGRFIGADHVISGFYDVRDDAQWVINREIAADVLEKTRARQDWEVDNMSGKASLDHLSDVAKDAAEIILKHLFSESSPAAASGGDSSLAKGRTVAVFSPVACPRGGRIEQTAGMLADLLGTDLQQLLSMRLVEREKIEQILAEKKLQFAGLAARGQAILAARILGAECLLTGSVVRVEKGIRVDWLLLDVASGAVVASASTTTTADKFMETHQDSAKALAQRIGCGLERVAKIGPSSSDCRIAEAQIQANFAEKLYWNSSDRDEAFLAHICSLIRIALELAPDDGLTNKCAGKVAFDLRSYTAAERYLRKGVELSPKSPECHLAYANYLLARGDTPEKTLEHARKAVELFGKDLPLEKLYKEVSAQSVRTMTLALMAAGQLDEAGKWASGMMATGDSTTKTVDAVVAVLKAQGKYREAADYVAKKGYSDLAAELSELAGQSPDMLKRLALLVRQNQINTEYRLLLAKTSTTSNPEFAAMLCRKIIQHAGLTSEKLRPPSDPRVGYTRSDVYPIYAYPHQPVTDAQATTARRILKEMGQTPEIPLMTGPVFDIEALRKRGIKFALLNYEKFPYEKELPYLQAYLEDVFGIPIVTNKGTRPVPPKAFDAVQGFIYQCNDIDFDLIHGQQELKCVAVTGLMGFPISQLSGKRLDLAPFSTERSMISTTECARHTPATHSAKTFIVGNMLRNLSYCVGTRIRPYTVIRAMDPSCAVQACVLSEYSQRDYEMVPCPVCRKELYEIRKNWEKGPEQRESIVAGPTEPAMVGGKNAGEVLLVPMDISAEDAKLDAVSKCLSASLGLRSKIHARIDRKIDIPAEPKSLAEISPKLAGVDKQYAAVCVFTGKRYCAKDWNKMLVRESIVLSPPRWRVWIPGLDEPGPKTACPLVIMSVAEKRDFNLPTCYRRLETLNVDKGGSKESVQAPAYSKLLIGALASAARKDHECWTLGCPTTVWETIGVPHRCSHYLCPECRKAVAAYYSTSRN